MRELIKVRKVGGTLDVTLTQGVLEDVSLSEGDRVLIEALPPKRILISREEQKMPNTRRLELELEVLASQKTAVESDIRYKAYQHNSGMPCEPGMDDDSITELAMRQLSLDRDKLAVEIAKKRLELFELQGA